MLSRTDHGAPPGARARPATATATDPSEPFYRHLAQAVWAGYLVTVVGICAAAALFLLHGREERIEAATAQALTLTRALDEHVRRTLSGVDIVLGVVAADIVARGGVDRIPELMLHDELRRKLALLPQVSSMFVYRSDLQLHAGSGFYPVPRVDGNQLMHVSPHLSPTSTSLLVSKPLMSPVANRWTIPVTRRVSAADGTLIGVVGAAIDTSHFNAFYRELDLPPGVGLALVRDSGELLFRFPEMGTLPPGTDLSTTSPVFKLSRPLQQPVTLRYASQDGIERLFTFRRVGDLGVMVAVSHDVQALLAPWRRDAVVLTAGVAVALLALTLLLWVALVQIRRRAADERAHHDTLESKVRERTNELEAANEELEAFSYSASHDLRSPLHAMSGLMFLLRRDRDSTLSPKAVDLLDKSTASVDTMTQLIDDLIGLSRSSRQAIHAGPVDLSALAHEVADSLARQQQAGSPAQLQVAPDLMAQGDPGLLRIVLHNLLSNAIKYSSKATQPRVEFGSERIDGERVFFVRDNGAGFAMADAHRLFRPFQRLHKRSDYAGSGIGLATAARIVRRHGGRIWADSAPGQGATFRFTLPDAGTHERGPLVTASAS